eukprot:1158197-Pelagomonas_calceolata.AAC.4
MGFLDDGAPGVFLDHGGRNQNEVIRLWGTLALQRSGLRTAPSSLGQHLIPSKHVAQHPLHSKMDSKFSTVPMPASQLDTLAASMI